MPASTKTKSTKTTTAKSAVAKKAVSAAKPTKSAPASTAKAAKTKSVSTAKVAKPAAAAKKSGKTAPARRKPEIPLEQRRNYVEVAAYYIAERHGFTPGRELADWAEAEAKIERLLNEGLLNP